jgi:hypothetical protein
MIMTAFAGFAVDEVEGAREAGLLVQRGDHLVGHDAVHRRALVGRRTALDELCVHAERSLVWIERACVLRGHEPVAIVRAPRPSRGSTLLNFDLDEPSV